MSAPEHDARKDRPPPIDDALRERARALVVELLDLLDGRRPEPRPPASPKHGLRLLRGGAAPAPRILKRG